MLSKKGKTSSGKKRQAKGADKLKEDKTSKKSPVSNAEDEPKAQFPIVGVGASAGGLEAFTQLFEHLPADTGMAFVLVQHLAATHESILTELLSKVTTMHVREVKDGLTVEPDNVYVIPPNTEMAILHGVLHLKPRIVARGLHMPVDSFLRSLAEDRRDDAIAVIMSGTGSDGSLGIRAIKAEGGITFAQEEASAKYSGMPGSAIATDCVDFILKPEKIAKELIRISRHPYLRFRKSDGKTIAEEGDNLSKIFLLLRTKTGVDFTYYKSSTIKRRIMRRMLLQRTEKLENYIKYIRENPSEVEALYQDILINVTSFFREPAVCDVLKSSVFPQITEKAPTDLPVRLWIPGCSTGEEAYSMAICLLEFFDERKISSQIQIFATDIDDAAIEKARKGVYPENISNDVSPERLRKFFVKIESGYQINKTIREMCIFARQNLVKDPPFSNIDLISCRNLLIYFGPVLQKKAIPMMHYALKPTGFLMLGTSETVGEFSNEFTLIDNKNKLYSKKHPVSKLHFEQTSEKYAKHTVPPFAAVGVKPVSAMSDIQKAADSIVMNRYSPAGVVINEEMKVLQFRGDTGSYLQHGPGEASLTLTKMCREGLMLELRTAIQKAKKDGQPVKKEGVRFKDKNQLRLITIEVIPFKASLIKDLYFLVLFEDETTLSSIVEKDFKSVVPSDISETNLLQIELATAREYLSAVTTEHEAANEELMALNEELQSSNEEMQSINEELETAKEELQSTNEELITVNDELNSRNAEMTEVTNDVINLLSGIEIPVILLGNELQIRRFNPSAGKLLNLIAADAGRPITDIRTNIDLPDLKELIVGVMDTLAIKEHEIQDTEGRWYSMTIRPYKTIDNRIDGVLMTLVDINELKQAATEREKLISELKEAISNVKTLSSMLPICATCKKIRDDKGYWKQLESYISSHTDTKFTHGICPDCAKKAYEELEKLKNENI